VLNLRVTWLLPREQLSAHFFRFLLVSFSVGVWGRDAPRFPTVPQRRVQNRRTRGFIYFRGSIILLSDFFDGGGQVVGQTI
jgi:hypothetical protein